MRQKFIVFGGSGGIGSALARRKAARGDSVHLVGRSEARLESLANELNGSFSIADVLDRVQVDAALAEAGSEIAGLAYAVGSITLKPFARLTDEDALRDFQLNALGAFRVIQAALPGLKAGGEISSVILFSTVAVSQGFPSHATIGMAKGAVEGLTLSLAAELAPRIRVNCIAPSLTKTPLSMALTSNEPMAKAIAGLHALQRLGDPDDVAAMAAFLLSPEAGWISGQIIGVDGGRSSLRSKG